MRSTGLILLVMVTTLAVAKPQPHLDTKLSIEERIAYLLDQMTLEEKIAQMDMISGRSTLQEGLLGDEEALLEIYGNDGVGSVHDYYPSTAKEANQLQRFIIEHNRFGIPALFIEETLHGYVQPGSTIFPIPLAMAASWDTAAVREAGHVIAKEARLHGTHVGLSPVLGLAREPRWGRVEETFGEDTYLASRMGVAMVQGMQGDDLSDPDVIATVPKHFAMHSVPLSGTNSSPAYLGKREALQYYLPVFEAAIREGGARGVMSAYSEWNGVPCTGDPWLLTDLLRTQWGFNGFVLADMGAVRMLATNHHVTEGPLESLLQGIGAGVDMQFYDFPSDQFRTEMFEAVHWGKLDLKTIDRAVAAILRLKYELDLVASPFTNVVIPPVTEAYPYEQKHAYQVASKSVVLLSNDGVLPLKKSVNKIAVLGPAGTSSYPGGYSPPEANVSTLLNELNKAFSVRAEIRFDKSASFFNDGSSDFQKAVELANWADVVILALGEDESQIGENRDRSSLELSGNQSALVQALSDINTPKVMVLINGRPIALEREAKQVNAIVEGWFGGDRGTEAITSVLSGEVNPSGKLPISFPRSTGTIPCYYNHTPSKILKTVDGPVDALFPFGHGLSYTTFSYSDLQLETETLSTSDTLRFSLSVKNDGERQGETVVQVYLRDLVSSVTTPVKELKAFRRIELEAGQTSEVSFAIPVAEFRIINADMQRVVEPGEFRLMIGESSRDIRLETTFRVE
ncbi:glycoside hydrolase family 3 C-terminal domain-containing protein [bacterium]|nr:glycoside hydrolase family 3 C-terminal domain-containing protein [bacterium]